MSRPAAATDVFTAVAEPRRREIVDVLSGGELPVNEVVRALGIAQPLVSKHLKVLREVRLVESRIDGRQRYYRLNASSLKAVHDWVTRYEHLWNERLDRLEVYLDETEDQEGQHDD